jgi:hypothetical protein
VTATLRHTGGVGDQMRAAVVSANATTQQACMKDEIAYEAVNVELLRQPCGVHF